MSVGPDKTVLVRDGQERFRAAAGIVVRDYTVSASGVSAKVHSNHGFHRAIREFESGTLTLKVDGQSNGKVKLAGGSGNFTVPRGELAIEITCE